MFVQRGIDFGFLQQSSVSVVWQQDVAKEQLNVVGLNQNGSVFPANGTVAWHDLAQGIPDVDVQISPILSSVFSEVTSDFKCQFGRVNGINFLESAECSSSENPALSMNLVLSTYNCRSFLRRGLGHLSFLFFS